jgi:hypothetical protein
MAGIEKICEFSDQYPGWEMYGYKRNGIQIMPEFRKLFRGADATLVIVSAEVHQVSFMSKRGYCYSSPCKYQLAEDFDFNVSDYVEYHEYMGKHFKIDYKYALVVKDKALQGTVGGRYTNWSMNLSTVMRKMKRMVGPNLRIVNEAGSRAQILSNWRKQFIKDAREYQAQEEREAA